MTEGHEYRGFRFAPGFAYVAERDAASPWRAHPRPF